MLREGLQRLAGWRLKAMGGWRRPETLVIDIDSLPVEVHGEQPGSAWNGYYHRRVYHPIVAAAGETGDILDLRLREGQVHTADGGLEFVLEVLERAERHLCGKAAVRFDAGYPGEPLMAALEERGTHYVARVRNNAVLKRLSLPAMDAVVWDALRNGAPAGEPRTWVCESSYRAGSWSRSRRVVQVVVERPGELIPRCFWLLTSMPSGEMSGEDLLALYRKRGKAEGHLGELMSVVAPALSSTSRRKSHYRGREIRKREKGVDAFACNQVRLLLAGFGYQIMHVQRALLERVTGTGWSLRRLAERVLRTPARFNRLGPPDHDDHRRRFGALAHARPRTRDPARRALRIARPHRRADPSPGPAARTAPRCLQVPETEPAALRELRVPHPDPGRTAPKTPFGGPSPLPKPRQPPKLLSMSRFMSKVGSGLRACTPVRESPLVVPADGIHEVQKLAPPSSR